MRCGTPTKDAIRRNRIKLEEEKAAGGDPYPGRYLNPHKKVGSFCRILKHNGLLSSLRLLTGRESKALQTSRRIKARNSARTPIRST